MGNCSTVEETEATLYVRVVEARGLVSVDDSLKPYCRIKLKNVSRASESNKVGESPNDFDDSPMWSYNTSFKLSNDDLAKGLLSISVVDKRAIDADPVLGTARIKLAQFEESDPFEGWVELKPPDNAPKKLKEDAPASEIFVKIVYSTAPVNDLQRTKLCAITPPPNFEPARPYDIRAYCLTFNCGNADLSDLYKWIPLDASNDLYIISHQEMYMKADADKVNNKSSSKGSKGSKGSSDMEEDEHKVESLNLMEKIKDALFDDSKNEVTNTHQSEFIRLTLAHLNSGSEEYYCLANHKLFMIRLFIFCKAKYRSKVSNVRVAQEVTGFFNIVRNKGAVACSFDFDGTSFGIVSSHLAAHQHLVEDRNKHYKQICQNLPRFSYKYHHVIWLGDVNYRIDYLGQRDHPKSPEKKVWSQLVADVESCRAKENFDELVQHDQLLRAIDKNEAFYGFIEGKINFPPTFKLQRDANLSGPLSECYIDERLPAYTDRILFKSIKMSDEELQILEYGSDLSVVCSDHTPVFAKIGLSVYPKHVSVDDRCDKCVLRLDSLNARGLTCINLIGGDKIDAMVKVPKQRLLPKDESIVLTEVVEDDKNPQWKDIKCEIPIARTSLKYLQHEILYFKVKNRDSMRAEDVIGFAALGMKRFSRNANKSVQFQVDLIMQGVSTGLLEGEGMLVWKGRLK